MKGDVQTSMKSPRVKHPNYLIFSRSLDMFLLSEHEEVFSTLKTHTVESLPIGEEVKSDFCLMFAPGASEVTSFQTTL